MSNRLKKVQLQRERRANRVRAGFVGTTERPRLHVSVTNRHVSAQIIDDTNHATVAAVSTVGKKIEAKSLAEKADWVGKEIAKTAKAKNVSKVVYDRGFKLYHGRVKALAEAAREAGLEF